MHPEDARPGMFAYRRRSTLLTSALRCGAPVKVVRVVVEACPELVFVPNGRRGSVLHEAISNRRLSVCVLEYLIEYVAAWMHDRCESNGHSSSSSSSSSNCMKGHPFLSIDSNGRTPLNLLVSRVCGFGFGLGLRSSLIRTVLQLCPSSVYIADHDGCDSICTALRSSKEIGNMENELKIYEVVKMLLTDAPPKSFSGKALFDRGDRLPPLYHAIVNGRSAQIVELILKYDTLSTLKTFPPFNENILHVAVSMKAPFDVLSMIVQKWPYLISNNDDHGLSPLSWLWIRYVCDRSHQTYIRQSKRRHVPMNFRELEESAIRDIIAKFESPRTLRDLKNGQFWRQAYFMIRFVYTHHCKDTMRPRQEDYLLHAALKLHSIPAIFYSIAFEFVYSDDMRSVTKQDHYGRTPLHYAAMRGSFERNLVTDRVVRHHGEVLGQVLIRMKDHIYPVKDLLFECPWASSIKDRSGQFPLHLFLKRKCWCSSGKMQSNLEAMHTFHMLMVSHVEAVGVIDPCTRLYPFMIALVEGASEGSERLLHISFAYEMLKLNPSVLSSTTNQVGT